ncbi:hypothetical protein PMAYCL1PPCAC_08174, partial [Pristionchus mayeri]
AEKTRRVDALRAENEKSAGTVFSRACHECRAPHPLERVVLTHCGHAVCRACADADARRSLLLCTTCETVSAFVRLFEEKTEEGVRHTDDSPAASISRVCGVCYAANPAVRAVITTCGHVACLACIEQLKSANRVKCPFCRENSPVVRLVEPLLSK